MTFHCDGNRYDSDDLKRFETGTPGVTCIYMTTDHSAVFVVTEDRQDGTRIHRADEPEIFWLIHRFGLSELLEVLPETAGRPQDSDPVHSRSV